MTKQSNDDVLKKARAAHKKKYGSKMSEEMARRARLSHQAQVEKYGGEEKYKQEMGRRSKKHLKDAEQFSQLEEQA